MLGNAVGWALVTVLTIGVVVGLLAAIPKFPLLHDNVPSTIVWICLGVVVLLTALNVLKMHA